MGVAWMRARKIAVLLAITAISALTMFFIVLADTDAFGAETDQQYSGCETPLLKGPDSKARVEVLAVLGDGGSGDLRLPLVFENTTDFKPLSGPISLPAPGTLPVPKEGM